MEQITKENAIEQKLEYIGLDLENVPEFLWKEFRPLEFRPLRLYNEEIRKVYRYLDVKDIQILITTSNKADLLKNRYQNADPIYFYINPQEDDDIIKHTMFLKLIQEMQIDKIKEIEEEQKKLSISIPFEVKYLKNYLWQIYYAEETNQYFMLVSIEETDTSCLFYLLREQIKSRQTGESNKIYVPINNIECSRQYLKKSELQDIEKYLWLFTKDWPITYEVWDKDNQASIQIVGTTNVYEKIKSNYKIVLNSKEEATRFYKLLKALFIMQTEISHEYNFEVIISDSGSLDFLYDGKVIAYDYLSRFLKNEYENKRDTIIQIEKELREVEEKLQDLIKIEKQIEKEYKQKEKQIATFLEYRKTFFGRIKYFFKKGKLVKNDDIENNETKNEEEEKKKIELQEKEYYTIEDLLDLCKQLENLNTELKNKKMDEKALEYKVENVTIKLKNATEYIAEIDKHKKSLFEFWKFANKDNTLALTAGRQVEEIPKQTKMKRVFDYEDDFEDLGIQWDKYQKKELKREECDSIYIITNNIILQNINELRKKEEYNLEYNLNLLKEKASNQLFSEEDFDIFGSVSEDHTKIKTLGKNKHRERKKNEIQLLDITKITTKEQYESELRNHLTIIEGTMDKLKAIVDISLYMAQDKVLSTDELGLFHVNPNKALEEVANVDKVNLFRVNIKQGMPAIALSNIIFYDNKNKTLPDGMNESDKILLDMSKFKFELKRQKLFRLNQSVNEVEVKNKIICVYEYDVTM